MRIAAVGTHYGHFGMMLNDALTLPDVEFVGVAEEDDGLRETWAAKLNCAEFRSAEELFDATTPDLVIEGCRIHEKTALVQLCAAAGCHLLLDKPVGLSMQDLDDVATAAIESGITLSMYFTLRYTAPYVAVRQLVTAGELGAVVNVISTHPHKLSPDRRPQLLFHRDTYPGTLCDIVCHGVDYVRWLTGAEPVSVTATHGNIKYPHLSEFEDHAEARFQFSNGTTAYITADWLYPEESPSFGDSRLVLTGTEGTANLRAWAKSEVEVAKAGAGTSPVELPPTTYARFLTDLFDALDRGEQPPVGTHDVLRTAYACLIARASADNGGVALGIDYPYV